VSTIVLECGTRFYSRLICLRGAQFHQAPSPTPALTRPDRRLHTVKQPGAAEIWQERACPLRFAGDGCPGEVRVAAKGSCLTQRALLLTLGNAPRGSSTNSRAGSTHTVFQVLDVERTRSAYLAYLRICGGRRLRLTHVTSAQTKSRALHHVTGREWKHNICLTAFALVNDKRLNRSSPNEKMMSVAGNRWHLRVGPVLRLSPPSHAEAAFVPPSLLPLATRWNVGALRSLRCGCSLIHRKISRHASHSISQSQPLAFIYSTTSTIRRNFCCGHSQKQLIFPFQFEHRRHRRILWM